MDPVFKSIAESSPDSIMLLDRGARIDFINRTAPGLTIADVIGTRVYEYVPPGQHAAMRACFERVAKTGEPDGYENVYVDPEGRNLLWESRVGPVNGNGGEVVGFVVMASDVTQRRADALDRDRVFELSLDLMCVTAQDGRFTLVNPAFTRVLGHSSEVLLKGSFFDYLHPQEADAIRLVFGSLPEEGTVTDIETRYRCQDGEYRALQWRAIYDADSQRIHAVARDVTRQRVMQTQLLQSQKMQAVGLLSGGIAHDFNNLMLAILANTRFALEGQPDEEEQQEVLMDIRSAAQRAADLTKQLLSVSRREPVRTRAVDISGLARPLMKLVRRLIPESIEIDFALADDLPHVEADPGQLEQVLLNLCVNARDAIDGQGRVLIEAELAPPDRLPIELRDAASSFVCVGVVDTGRGVAPGVQERMFEPFFTTKAAGAGTGLGLSTVYGIVQEHRGAVQVESTLGQGTRISVFLPVSRTAGSESLVREEGESVGGNETLLVAEDELLVRNVVVRTLETAGYKVIAASDGVEALALFEVHKDEIDLALLDVVMPGRSGPEVRDVMARRRSELPVVFTSGYAETAAVQEMAAQGAEVLAKPYAEGDLLARIRVELDQSQARNAARSVP